MGVLFGKPPCKRQKVYGIKKIPDHKNRKQDGG